MGLISLTPWNCFLGRGRVRGTLEQPSHISLKLGYGEHLAFRRTLQPIGVSQPCVHQAKSRRMETHLHGWQHWLPYSSVEGPVDGRCLIAPWPTLWAGCAGSDMLKIFLHLTGLGVFVSEATSHVSDLAWGLLSREGSERKGP